MDYEKFLWAMCNETLMNYIKRGMPQAVSEYAKNRNYQKVDKIKRTILKMYREDIRKYSENLNLKVEQIFDTIPSQLQKHEKKIQYFYFR